MSENSPQSARTHLAVLIENLFDATQIRQLEDFATASNIQLTFLSHLWGHDTLTFQSDDPNFQVEVGVDVSRVVPVDFDGLLLADGYAMDRLRYQAFPICGGANQAPAVEFLRVAVTAMNEGLLTIGAIGHGLMLFTAAPETLQGRQVTCAHNIIGEVASAGGFVMFNGNQTADLHLDRGLLTARDTAAAPEFFAALAREMSSRHPANPA